MSRKLLVTVAIVACIAFSGCKSLTMSKSMSPVQKGGLAGAAIGAATGGICAANTGGMAAYQGALMGAGAGGTLGAVGADLYARRKTAHDDDALQAEIENLKNQSGLKGKRIEELEGQIEELQDQIDRKPQAPEPPPDEISQAPAEPAAPLGDDEVRELQRAIGADVEVGRSDKGITLTFVSEVLFASGKAALTKSGVNTLHKTAEVLRQRYPNNEINIEGHTDNVPIKFSGYRSNWELSTDRSTSVVHFLIDREGFRPDLLSVTGYGETRPVAPNDAALGRRLNRRAVIVIMPDIKYQKQHMSL